MEENSGKANVLNEMEKPIRRRRIKAANFCMVPSRRQSKTDYFLYWSYHFSSISLEVMEPLVFVKASDTSIVISKMLSLGLCHITLSSY